MDDAALLPGFVRVCGACGVVQTAPRAGAPCDACAASPFTMRPVARASAAAAAETFARPLIPPSGGTNSI